MPMRRYVDTLRPLRRPSSRSIFNEQQQRIICISVAPGCLVPCCGYSREDNWFGSAISFARSPRYVSRYVSSSGAMAILRADLIFVKNAPKTKNECVVPSAVFVFFFFFFHRLIYSTNYRGCLHYITAYNHRKRTRMIAWICIKFIFILVKFLFIQIIDYCHLVILQLKKCKIVK